MSERGIFRVTRRQFLRDAGLATGAVVFGSYISPKGAMAAEQSLGDIIRNGATLNSFVAIEPLTGTIIIMAHRSEMGQGIRSTLAAVLADDLEADWSKVRVRQADADGPRYAVANTDPVNPCPKFLIPEEVSQFADSSRSVSLYFLAMRAFGTGIRLVFQRAAARHWGVDPKECEGKQHKVWHKPSGRSIDYGDPLLLLNAKKVTPPEPTLDEITAALKPPDQCRFIGKKMPFVDAQDMVIGKAVYGADADPGRRGMLTAMIVHCPVANGTLKSFDDKDARAVPGVRDVRPVFPIGAPGGGVGMGFLPHAGVAVIAENTWAAWQGRHALKVEWDRGDNEKYNSDDYRHELEASTAQPGKLLRHRGDVDAAFGTAAKTVEADYYVPHLAQAPMEPPAAVALYENGKWEVWSPTQGPELAQHYIGLILLEPNPIKWLLWQVTELSEVHECEQDDVRDFNESLGKLLNLDFAGLIKARDDLKARVRDAVKVHVTLLGGGFGRKSKPDYAIEAAALAQQFPGVPIRVQWTREDDIQFSYFHVVSNQHMKAALDGDGHTTAWLQRSAFPSFFATLFPTPTQAPPIFQKARKAFHNGGEYPYASAIERAHGLEDMPFDVKNLRIENCEAKNHIRTGWMRSVSNIFHAFSIGSFADELAIAAGRDSKDYLLELIGRGRILDLPAEGVKCFDNNGFPMKGDEYKCESGKRSKLSPYPPDTRRLRAVVEEVANRSGWDAKVKQYKTMKGRGLGIAAHRSFLSYMAIVMDVSLNDKNELTINDVYAAMDCGFPVNPDRVLAQIEGGIVYGLSIALHGEITVKGGAVEQHNFDDYPVLRIYQTPKNIAMYFVQPSADVIKDLGGTVLPTGVGEVPVPPVAPALANAIVAAGGPRIREVPFRASKPDERGKVVVL